MLLLAHAPSMRVVTRGLGEALLALPSLASSSRLMPEVAASGPAAAPAASLPSGAAVAEEEEGLGGLPVAVPHTLRCFWSVRM